MRAIIKNNEIVGIGNSVEGVEIPLDLIGLPYPRLKHLNGSIVDAETISNWYIDPFGRKFTTVEDGRELIACEWDDELVQENGSWRVKTQVDFNADLVTKTEAEIDRIADEVYTISLSRAARYDRKFEQATAYKEAGYPPDASDYPYIENEALERSITEQEMADLILAKADALNAFGVFIEAKRAALKIDIGTATDDIARQTIAEAAILAVETERSNLGIS